jgi:signal transduction histidine kinase
LTAGTSSLRTRLILSNTLALAVLLGVLGLFARYTVRSFLQNAVRADLAKEAGRMRLPRMPDRQGRRLPPITADFPYRPHHWDIHGRSIVAFDTRPMLDRAGFEQALRGQRHYSTVVVNGEPVQVLSEPVREDGAIAAVLQLGYPVANMNLAMEGLDRALLILIPVGLIFSGLLGAFVTRRVLGGVHATTRAAEQISTRDLSARLPVLGRDEFSDLAATFNRLLARLQTAFADKERLLEKQRQFIADASHELKTPLTVIKGTASMASQAHPGFQEIDRAADTMARLVHDLLLLARGDDRQLGRETTELLLRELLERAKAAIGSGGAPIEIKLTDETLSVIGNEAELIRLFANLLENAARHTPDDGLVKVTSSAAGPEVVVRITDAGPGIAPEHLPHLGERFYRTDASRSRREGGTGLGLSICKSIVEAHHGRIEFESKLGAGTIVTVFLPRPPS